MNIEEALSLIDESDIPAGSIWDSVGVEACDASNALMCAVNDGHEVHYVVEIMLAQINGAKPTELDPVALISCP